MHCGRCRQQRLDTIRTKQNAWLCEGGITSNGPLSRPHDPQNLAVLTVPHPSQSPWALGIAAEMGTGAVTGCGTAEGEGDQTEGGGGC